ncbi:hypothetical protein FSARC_448 [Fusarium sarcochroum]|uniref:DUF676 domain-containing protein n=1 Tax=Fusarium sarcochroum TaxID=1208366 RepID=A0A8H4UBF8_9HYPO|nr:hypothetical protein FSARC_448 [Fusarium sarcochroum]
MSLRRTATRRRPVGAGDVAPRQKNAYEKVKQGVQQLYPEPDSDRKTDMDIVFVPGLGAHPLQSWKSTTGDFNWASDTAGGIARDFPNARILLYHCESSWTGSIKVKQFLSNLAQTLLDGLKINRENMVFPRPITFIGHSMGGLVIAKAITIAENRPDAFPGMFEDIAGCAFFGTPFHGAEAASLACMLSEVGEKVGQATTSSLLKIMKPDDETLNELRKEFIRLTIKISPKIELCGFWEEHPTTIKDLSGMPQFLSSLNIPIPKKYAEFVTRESAILDGVMDSMGLAANHRDLVKFDNSKDERFALVRSPLKRLVNGSHLRVKNRHNATRFDDPKLVSDALKTLQGAQAQSKKDSIAENTTTSPWFSKEPEFVGWLAKPAEAQDASLVKKGDCLWVRGRDGRGKTSAALSAVEVIEKLAKDDAARDEDTAEDSDESSSRIILAYFFCDTSPDYGSAEGLLKSLIYQLILKQPLAAVQTKFLLKKRGRETQPLLTVENLWQVLQDILADNVFAGASVYFVLNNLEALSQDALSTPTLLSFLSSEVEHDGAGRRPTVRWMFTSDQSWDIDQALRKPLVRLVDLEDEKYGDQVQLELRKHAQKKVLKLIEHKKYSRALGYFASSVIGHRAQNTQWIDITVDHLEELPQHQNDLQVRSMLEVVPQDLDALLNSAWLQVFENNRTKAGEIKEMLRVLVLTYEDPTEAELGLLAGLDSSDEQAAELHDLIQKCRPLLVLKENEDSKTTVCFTEAVVKQHILENAHKLLGLTSDDIKLQHGILGFRSFSHILEKFDFPPIEIPDEEDEEDEENDENDENDDAEEEDGDQEEDQDGGNKEQNHDAETVASEESSDAEEEEEDEDPEAPYLKDKALAYAVKNWLPHASEATTDIAEALSLEKKFWNHDSIIRTRWLTEHTRLVGSFKWYDRSLITGLHIAAAIGFRQLASALMDNGYDQDKDATDSDFFTPLHYAAAFGQPDIVEELLDRGAHIDEGNEYDVMTPLHKAAAEGNVKVMAKLLQRGADPNASCNSYGGVINAAIESGNCDAVKLLVTHNVSLVTRKEEDEEESDEEDGENEDEENDEDDDDEDDEEESDDDDEDEIIWSPLALAAMRADLTVFEFLIKEYSDKLPPEEFDIALIKAAELGRQEAFTRLYNDFEHTQEAKQNALDKASYGDHWAIVSMILDNCPDLDCDMTFLLTAQGPDGDDKIRILGAMWEYSQGGISPETLDNSLYEATDMERERTVELLLQYGASANATGKEYGDALTAAAFDGTINIVKMLLDAGADINSADGWALQTAAEQGHTEVVNLLLERGANVNAFTTHEDMSQGSALQAAVESGRGEIVDILLEHGADPNLGGGEFAHPIIAAASKSENEIFEALLRAKADVNVTGGEYMSTPLIYAAMSLPESSLRLLLDAGADMNFVDKDGDTALIVTAWNGDTESVQFLLDNGADVLHKNDEGENALQKALNTGKDECVEILVEHVSALMDALRVAMESGDAAVTAVVRSVQNKKQELNYDDPEVPANEKNRRSSNTEANPPQSENHAVDHDAPEFHSEKMVVDDHSSHVARLEEPPSRIDIPSASPPGPFAAPAQDILEYTPEPLFRRQSDISPGLAGVPPQAVPIRRKPIGHKPPAYRPYQPNGSGENVRHSTPPEGLSNPFQAYQPDQLQSPPHDGHVPVALQETYSPPSHTSPEPGFMPYSPPAPVNYGQPGQDSGRKSSRTSFMGMKVPWSGDRFN